MSANYSTDSDDIELRNYTTGDVFGAWGSYSYNEAFDTPTDAFSFTCADERVQTIAAKFPVGTRVTLSINDKPQCSGSITSASISSATSGGSVLKLAGYDALYQLVRATMDPLFVMGTGLSLQDLVRVLATPYGFLNFSTTDIARRSVVTGNAPGATVRTTTPATTVVTGAKTDIGVASYPGVSVVIPATTTEYDPTKPVFLKDITLQQTKPHFPEEPRDAGQRRIAREIRAVDRADLPVAWAGYVGSE